MKQKEGGKNHENYLVRKFRRRYWFWIRWELEMSSTDNRFSLNLCIALLNQNTKMKRAQHSVLLLREHNLSKLLGTVSTKNHTLEVFKSSLSIVGWHLPLNNVPKKALSANTEIISKLKYKHASVSDPIIISYFINIITWTCMNAI